MHLPMEIIGEKALRLLLKEYEDNQLFLHQMVIEVPQLMLPPGVATLERLIRAGLRIYFRQFTQLTGKDVDRIAFFLGLVLIGGIRTYVSDRPQQLSKKEFIKDLNKIAQDYVHSHNWHLPN